MLQHSPAVLSVDPPVAWQVRANQRSMREIRVRHDMHRCHVNGLIEGQPTHQSAVVRENQSAVDDQSAVVRENQSAVDAG